MSNSRLATHDFLDAAIVWPTLLELAKRCAEPRLVATPYIGETAADRFGFREGDVLVVALSEQNARNGSVSPGVLQRLVDRGVEVFLDEALHAKVYVLGGCAVIGSANLSDSSFSALREAAIVTRDPLVVRRAASWIRSLCNVPATRTWLEHCSALYRPSLRAATRLKAAGRLWLVGITPIEFPAEEDEERAEGEAVAETRVSTGFGLETLRFTALSRFAREVKVGDLVIQAWRHGGVLRVYPHARVLATRPTHRADGGRALYVYVELPAEPTTLTWSRFSREMLGAGLRLGRNVGTRELRGDAVVDLAKHLTMPARRGPLRRR